MSTNYYDAENNKLIKISGKGDFPADYGTKEEFETKKDSLPDGTVFTTTDEFVDAHAENYSTDEVVIGTWIDGKPIYRKVYSVDFTTSQVQSVADLNIDMLIKLQGEADRSGYKILITSNGEGRYIGYNLSNNTIYWACNDSSFRLKYILIEYTKTN